MVQAYLLGTAQDAGIPQAGCACENCRRAHADASVRRLVACLGLADLAARKFWLVDATPDIREQLHAMQAFVPNCEFAGIILTHAHIGHYTGLIQLGPEVMNAREFPLFVTRSMAEFLRQNLPWRSLIENEHIFINLLEFDTPFQLSRALSIIALQVPHRDEYSDTIALLTAGEHHKLFFCPDIDDWDAWDKDIRSFVSEIDIALLDSTFFSTDELPDRDMRSIPHPLATDTAERLAGLDTDIRLIHLNHTNPLQHEGAERTWLQECGLHVGEFGDSWTL